MKGTDCWLKSTSTRSRLQAAVKPRRTTYLTATTITMALHFTGLPNDAVEDQSNQTWDGVRQLSVSKTINTDPMYLQVTPASKNWSKLTTTDEEVWWCELTANTGMTMVDLYQLPGAKRRAGRIGLQLRSIRIDFSL